MWLVARWFCGAMTVVCLCGEGAWGQVESVWDGSEGVWGDGAAWSSAPEFPDNGNGGVDYDVLIDAGQVTLDRDVVVDGLTLGGGEILGGEYGTTGGDFSLTIEENFSWSHGFIRGVDLIEVHGNAELGVVAVNELIGFAVGEMRLFGVTDWTWQDLGVDVLTNMPGATFNQMSQKVGTGNGNRLSGTAIDNLGTWVVDLDAFYAVGQVGAQFNNSGLVQVRMGALALQNGGVQTGVFEGDGALYFSGGNFSFEEGSRLNVSRIEYRRGRVDFNEGDFDLSGGYSLVDRGYVRFRAGTGHVALGDFRIEDEGRLEIDSGGVVTMDALFLRGLLAGSADVSVGGLFTFRGELEGTGAMTSVGEAVIDRSLLDGRVLNLMGESESIGETMTLTNSAELNNLAGATLAVNPGSWFVSDTGGERFNNFGLIVGQDTNFAISLVNEGTLRAEGGVLRMDEDSVHRGVIEGHGGTVSLIGGVQEFEAGSVSSSSALVIDGAVVSFRDGAQLVGEGGLRVLDGQLNIYEGAQLNNTGGIEVSRGLLNIRDGFDLGANGGVMVSLAGRLDIAGEGMVRLPWLVMDGGQVTGGSVAVSGMTQWDGDLSGAGVLYADGGGVFKGGRLMVRDIELGGTTRWVEGDLLLRDDSMIRTRVGATLAAELEEGVIEENYIHGFSGDEVIVNEGTFVRRLGEGVVRVESAFHNRGTVRVESGTLQLDGGGVHTGRWEGSGGLIRLGGSDEHVFGEGTEIEAEYFVVSSGVFDTGRYNVTGGTGKIGSDKPLVFGDGVELVSVGRLLIADGRVDFLTGGAIELSELRINEGGGLGGTDEVTVAGLFDWRGGEIVGDRVVHALGDARFDTGHSYPIGTLDGGELNLSGATEWVDGEIVIRSDGVLRNLPGATITATGLRPRISANLLDGAAFDNQGSLVVDVEGVDMFGDPTYLRLFGLVNGGVIEVLSGDLQLGGMGVHTGQVIGTGGRVRFGDGHKLAGMHVFEAGSRLSGQTIRIDRGKAHFHGGAFDQAAGTTVVTQGELRFFAGTDSVRFGELSVTGGLVRLDGGVLVQAGSVVQSGGEVLGADTLVAAGGVALSGGRFGLAGVVGDVVQAGGVLGPGDSPGVTHIDGDYTVTGGVVEIEIGGVSAGDGYDLVEVTGAASLGGVLQILLIDGFEPAYGDRFTIMSFGSRDGGGFDATEGVLVDSLLGFASIWSETQLVVRATVPGDVNFDDRVSIADIAVFALNFGTAPGPDSWGLGDFNGDGLVTVADLSLLALNFGFSLADGTEAIGLPLGDVARLGGIDLSAVPEPGVGLAMLVGGLGVLMGGRSGRRLS